MESRPIIKQPIDKELIGRCALYVREWFGIDHAAILRGEQEQPNEVPIIFISMHNALHGRQIVSDERIAAIGYRTIMKTMHPIPEIVQRREVLSHVPRIIEQTTQWAAPTMQAYEKQLRGAQ